MKIPTLNKSRKKNKKFHYSPLQITLIYAFFGMIWILFSDMILNQLVSSKEVIHDISLIKGWVYVLLTALLIYTLVTSLVIRIQKEESKLKHSYDQIYTYAFEDQLTKLPNRRLFYSELSLKVTELEKDKRLILFLIDVDNFKYINDLHGHDYGDQVIIHIANNIKNLLKKDMHCYHMGGDEFAILTETAMNNSEIKVYTEALVADFNKNFQHHFNSSMSLSIGIAILPDHTKDLNDLVKYADVALYKAKDAGKNTYMIFEVSLKEYIEQKIIYENLLKQALSKNEFVLYYQPQIDLKTGQVRGFEALIRWFNDELGMVSPAKFIPIAEETKLINEIGKWVLEEAVAYVSNLNKERQSNYTIAVNISTIQWMNLDFEDMVLNTLERYNLPAEYLELEVTESIMINSFEHTISKMQRLREKGIKVALDDFGTGYSSLNYLKQMPITTLKIDKTFIDDIFNGKSNQSILNTIISLGHTIGIEVVAEGVEMAEQVKYLTNNNCDVIQGYIYSKPISEGEIPAFLTNFVPQKK